MAKSNYSNTKVKARNLLTNVFYRRFKQKDFHNKSFIIDILSFIVQYFTPINLDRKLDNEKDKFMVKFLWDECIPHDFMRYIYKNKNYNAISNPKLTYQKANAIVKNFIVEDVNRINLLKYKIEKSFNLIHYIYSSLFPKIYNRTSNFSVQKESNFEFAFSTWKARKQNNEPIAPKIINELPTPTKQFLVTEMLSKPKNPKDYQNREVYEFEQAPLYFEKSVLDQTSPIAPGPKYRMTAKTVEIKKEIGVDNLNLNVKPDGTSISAKKVMDGSAKKVMDASATARLAKRRNERKEILQKQLSENTEKMNIIKKSKKQ